MINELLFILVMLISMFVVLLFSRLGKQWLLIAPPVLLLLANIFAPQLILVVGLTTSLAVPIYAAIFLATDVIAEIFGKKEARRVVWIGLIAQVLLVLFSQLIVRAEVLEFSFALTEAFKTIFSFTPRLVLGSMVAYIISQNYDVWAFHFLKNKFNGRHLWLRNNLSTMTSQLIDSVIIILIAFLGVLPNLVSFILSVWILKVVVAAIDTPFIYMARKMLKKT